MSNLKTLRPFQKGSDPRRNTKGRPIGRFLSEDPMFWAPESLLQDPQQLNSYSYARNNPITYIDPDGRSVKTFVQGAATSFAVGLLITGAIASASITIPAAALTAVGIAGTAAVGYGTYSNYQAYQNGNITKDQFDYNAGSLLGGLVIPGMAGKGASQAGEAESAITARFTQTGVSPEFNPKGSFAGKSLDEVISSLKSGSMSPSDLPINYMEGNGGRLVDNNRSAYVLQQAGIPESKWNWQTNNVNNPEVISRIEQKLFKNGLTNAGTDSVRVTSGKK